MQDQRTKLAGLYWSKPDAQKSAEKTPARRYRAIVEWAARARFVNPIVFDGVIKRILEAGAWNEINDNAKNLLKEVWQ